MLTFLALQPQPAHNTSQCAVLSADTKLRTPAVTRHVTRMPTCTQASRHHHCQLHAAPTHFGCCTHTQATQQGHTHTAQPSVLHALLTGVKDAPRPLLDDKHMYKGGLHAAEQHAAASSSRALRVWHRRGELSDWHAVCQTSTSWMGVAACACKPKPAHLSTQDALPTQCCQTGRGHWRLSV